MQDLGLTQADIYVLRAKMVYYPGQSHERQVRAFLPLYTPSGGLRAGGGQEGDGVEKQDYGSNFSADAPHPHPNPPLEGEGEAVHAIALDLQAKGQRRRSLPC